MSENQSEVLQPRRKPPVGHGVQSVARVQPLVPEVSIFVTSDEHPSARGPKLTVRPLENSRPLRTINGHQQRPPTPLSPPDLSPTPVRPPNQASLQASSEFSRLFAENALSVMSLDTCSKSTPELNSGNHPDRDVYKTLSWQNEQLVRLQKQVDELLSWRQSGKKESPVLLTDSSTQTSAPPSPAKAMYQETLEKDPPVVHPLEPLASSFTPEAGTVSEPDGLRRPLVGLHKKTDQIICKDLMPPQNINKLIDEEIKRQRKEEAQEPSTIQRLKDLGVSFVRPSDLEKEAVGEVSLWHPRAAEPSFTSATESTSDYSLMLNSAALKYLDDEHLSYVARHCNIKLPQEGGVTTYGLPDSYLSVATKEFLDRNRLTK